MVLTPKPGVLDIVPYVGGRAGAHPAPRVFKLASNESPFGPSPKAIEAYRAAAREIGVYPDGGVSILRETIAAIHSLAPGRIVCGNGSDEIITLLAHAYLRPGDEVMISQYGFLVYKIAALANSATPVEVPEPGLRTDVGAMLARVGPHTRLVYVANPNNPTGSYLTPDELKRLHAGLPKSALLVVDAAYAEYVRRNDYESGIELAAAADNVVMTRTFSKIYGLAGLRVGWAYCPAPVADVLNRVRGPFNVNVAAQRAAAAAMKDHTFTAEAVRHNEKWLAWLAENIHALGLKVYPSIGNFVLIEFPDKPGKRAADADRLLMARGLVLRSTANYGLPHCLRLTVGSEEANRLVVEALGDFMRAR